MPGCAHPTSQPGDPTPPSVAHDAVAPGTEQAILESLAKRPADRFSSAAEFQFASELASLEAPVLIMLGDHDFVRIDHALESFRLIRNAELAVIPDASHFAPFSEQDRVIPLVKHFLEKPRQRIPLATAGLGYRPGETR